MRKRPNGFTVVDQLVLNVIAALITAVTLPVWERFQARSKQSEAKANLKYLYVAEKAYLQEKDVYTTDVGRIGFEPERGNRYQYNLAAWSHDHLEERVGTLVQAHPGLDDGIAFDRFKFPLLPQLPTGNAARLPSVQPGPVGATFVAGAIGWVDDQLTPDIWTIADRDTPRRRGSPIKAGVPYNDLGCTLCGP